MRACKQQAGQLKDPTEAFKKKKMAEAKEDYRDQSFRDSISTIDASGKRAWIYAKKPIGKFYNYRTIFSVIYLLVFFTMPFIH